MAGYPIYSLDWTKFRDLVERPTPEQLTLLSKALAEELKNLDGEFDDGDPILQWPTKAKALVPIVAQRLALPDWYGDLSLVGKQLWEGTIFSACMDCKKLGLDFRVDSDGVYWDVIELAWKHLGVVPNTISDVALSTFGTRPYRYRPPTGAVRTRADYDQEEDARRGSLEALHKMLGQFVEGAKRGEKDPDHLLEELEGQAGITQDHKKLVKEFLSDDDFEDDEDEADDDWSPMHSMHPPEEVQKMWAELQSAGPAIKAAKHKDAWEDYESELMPAIERVARDGRMLFIQ